MSAFLKKGVREILAELEHGSKRFSELARRVRVDSGKLSKHTLIRRLLELEKEGLVLRTVYDSRPPKVVYTIAPEGKKLIQTIRDLKKRRKRTRTQD